MVGQPTEALLSRASVLSCPLVLPLGPPDVLLPLRHGIADADAGYTVTGSPRYVGVICDLILSYLTKYFLLQQLEL